MTAIGLHDSALEYALLGWPVMPCHSASNGRCTCDNPRCESPAKHPRTLNGLSDATIDPREIDRWWLRWPDANIAVVCGRGLVVVDIDGDAGRQSVAGRNLPITPVVTTGRGTHYYYAHKATLALSHLLGDAFGKVMPLWSKCPELRDEYHRVEVVVVRTNAEAKALDRKYAKLRATREPAQ